VLYHYLLLLFRYFTAKMQQTQLTQLTIEAVSILALRLLRTLRHLTPKIKVVTLIFVKPVSS